MNFDLLRISIFHGLRDRFGFTLLNNSLCDVSVIKVWHFVSPGFTLYLELVHRDGGHWDDRSVTQLDLSVIDDLDGVESVLEVARRILEVYDDLTLVSVAGELFNKDCAEFLARRVQQ
jgi:hypothetical protein